MGLIAQVSVFEELRSEEGNGTNVSVVKAALRLLGHDCGPVRAPGAWPLTERQMGKLTAALAAWGLMDGARAAA
jgi:4-hydroxy-tetrahydrodipicolinate synthase